MDEPENLVEAGARGRVDDVQEMIGGGAGLDILGGRPNFDHQQQPSLREVNSLFSLRHYLRENLHEGGGRPQGVMEVEQQANGSSNRHDLGGAPQVLPDFVQDHLHQDQMPYHNIGSHEPPIDIGVGHGNASASNNERIGPSLSAASSPSNSAPESSNVLPGSGEVGSSKSLPDFLSDGPIRSTRDAPQQCLSLQLENERLQGENERLRLQLAALEQRLRQQGLNNESRQADSNHSREGESFNLRNDLGAIENLEADLSLMTARALVAEDAVSRLKREMDSLKTQLRHRQGVKQAGPGPSRSDMPSTSAQQTQTERLASQLRNAAYNAEMSLRQLLSGVDNLRHLADSLDPLSPVISRASSVSSMDDEADGAYSSLPGRSRKRQ